MTELEKKGWIWRVTVNPSEVVTLKAYVCIISWHVHTAVTSDLSRRRLFFFFSLRPASLPTSFCSLSLNCVGVWQKPWQVERQMELTRLLTSSLKRWSHGLNALDRDFCFISRVRSDELWNSHSCVSAPVSAWHAAVMSALCPLLGCNIFSLCHPLCLSMSTDKPRHHKGRASGDQRLWIDNPETIFLIHTRQDNVCSY